MVTLEKFKRKDLCFEYRCKIYDYNYLNEFYEDISKELFEETDPVEFDIALANIVEKLRKIKVFNKNKFSVPADKMKEWLQGYIWEVYSVNVFDFGFELKFSQKAEKLLTKLAKVVSDDNKFYTTGSFVGFIDLSKEVEEYFGDD